MTQWHFKSKRKVSGGIRATLRRSDKKLSSKGNEPTSTTISASKETEVRENTASLGGNSKTKALKVFYANVTVSGQKKASKAQIKSVGENAANRLFTRRNIITKGAIIKIDLGGTEKTARVTSRPGQSGDVNAVLLEKN